MERELEARRVGGKGENRAGNTRKRRRAGRQTAGSPPTTPRQTQGALGCCGDPPTRVCAAPSLLGFSGRALTCLTPAPWARPTSKVDNGMVGHLPPTRTHNGEFLLLGKVVNGCSGQLTKKKDQSSLHLLFKMLVFLTLGTKGFHQF